MKLRDYQIDIAARGLQILKEKGLVYLSMETRTGKTLTALDIARNFGARRVLFASKKKALVGIGKDVAHYPDLEVTLINYESLHKISGTFDLVIADEAHSIGAYAKPAKRWKELRRFTQGVPCILLSATPSPESLSQLYHQLVINGRHPWCQYTNFYRWADRYVIRRERIINGVSHTDYSCTHSELIEADTKDYFISFTQGEAGIRHQVEEEILLCDMDPRLLDIIHRLNRDKVYYMRDGSTILADGPAKLLTKVQQVSSGTVIDEEGTGHILDHSKADFIRRIL